MPPALKTNTKFRWNARNATFRDDGYSDTRGKSLWEYYPALAIQCDPNLAYVVDEQFQNYVDGAPWTLFTEGAGTAALANAQGGGGIVVTTHTDANDEAYISHDALNFLPVAKRPIFFEVEVVVTEANVNDASWFVGLSTIAENIIKDGGLILADACDAVGFLKIYNGLTMDFLTNNNATDEGTTTILTVVSGTTYRLGFIIDPNDGTTAKCYPFIDGVIGDPLDLVIAGLAVFRPVIGVKCVAGTNAEAITAYRCKAAQMRVDWD